MKVRKKRKVYREAELQKQCLKWFRATHPGKLLVYINNNSPSLSAAKRNKAMGIVAGMTDLFLFVSAGTHHGLAIELKAEGESPKKHQLELHDKLRAAGYLVMVVRSLATFQKVISDYLGETAQ